MIIIREATLRDSFEIAKVQVDSNRSTYKGIMPEDYLNNLSYESKAQSWNERLFSFDSKEFMYLAETDNRNIVGFACAGLIQTNEYFERELHAIYILKEYQRIGIGKLLMKAVVSKYIESGIKSMLLWTLEDNPSRAFYENLGGKLVDSRTIVRGGMELEQVAYGWDEIASIHNSPYPFLSLKRGE